MYQSIKDKKRNEVAKDKGLDDEDLTQSDDPYTIIYNKLINLEIRNNNVLEGMGEAFNLDVDYLKIKLRKQLKKDKKIASLPQYYIDTIGMQKKDLLKDIDVLADKL